MAEEEQQDEGPQLDRPTANATAPLPTDASVPSPLSSSGATAERDIKRPKLDSQ